MPARRSANDEIATALFGAAFVAHQEGHVRGASSELVDLNLASAVEPFAGLGRQPVSQLGDVEGILRADRACSRDLAHVSASNFLA